MPVTDTQTPGATSPGGFPNWTIAEMDKVGR